MTSTTVESKTASEIHHVNREYDIDVQIIYLVLVSLEYLNLLSLIFGHLCSPTKMNKSYIELNTLEDTRKRCFTSFSRDSALFLILLSILFYGI